MHTLALENHPTEYAGGQERSLFEVLQFFASKGARVSLCYQREGELLEKYRAFAHEIFRIRSRQLQQPFVPFAADLVRLWSKSRTRGWDILYANQYSDTPMAASLGRLCGIPVVCHLRLACPSHLSRQYRWSLMSCAHLITISNHTRRTYVAAGIPAGRISVVYNGIDVQKFVPVTNAINQRASGGPCRVAYFGRLSPSKGVEVLLQALRLLKPNDPPVELRLIGDVVTAFEVPGYLEMLKGLAHPDLNRSVFFKPHCRDIRVELAETDLVVLPSTGEEAFGRVLIEAMASGVPVVASKVGGIPEVLGARFADQLVPPGDAKALAAAISKFANWRHTQPTLGTESRDWVIAKFSHADRWNDVLSIFQGVVHRFRGNARASVDANAG